MEPLYKVRTVPPPEMFEDMARVSMRKSPSTGLPMAVCIVGGGAGAFAAVSEK